MGENREYLAHAEENGSINISEDVVAAIAMDAMKEIEGVGPMSQNVGEQLTGKKAARGVRLDAQGDSLAIDLYLMVRDGVLHGLDCGRLRLHQVDLQLPG